MVLESDIQSYFTKRLAEINSDDPETFLSGLENSKRYIQVHTLNIRSDSESLLRTFYINVVNSIISNPDRFSDESSDAATARNASVQFISNQLAYNYDEYFYSDEEKEDKFPIAEMANFLAQEFSESPDILIRRTIKATFFEGDYGGINDEFERFLIESGLLTVFINYVSNFQFSSVFETALKKEFLDVILMNKVPGYQEAFINFCANHPERFTEINLRPQIWIDLESVPEHLLKAMESHVSLLLQKNTLTPDEIASIDIILNSFTQKNIPSGLTPFILRKLKEGTEIAANLKASLLIYLYNGDVDKTNQEIYEYARSQLSDPRSIVRKIALYVTSQYTSHGQTTINDLRVFLENMNRNTTDNSGSSLPIWQFLQTKRIQSHSDFSLALQMYIDRALSLNLYADIISQVNWIINNAGLSETGESLPHNVSLLFKETLIPKLSEFLKESDQYDLEFINKIEGCLISLINTKSTSVLKQSIEALGFSKNSRVAYWLAEWVQDNPKYTPEVANVVLKITQNIVKARKAFPYAPSLGNNI